MPAADDGGDGTKVEDVNKQESGVGDVTAAETIREKHDVPKTEPPEADDFGLPVRPPRRRSWTDDSERGKQDVNGSSPEHDDFEDANEEPEQQAEPPTSAPESGQVAEPEPSRARAATLDDAADRPKTEDSKDNPQSAGEPTASQKWSPIRTRADTVSEWSHQQLAPHEPVNEDESKEEDEWQAMPAFATHRIYDDWGKVLAKEYAEVDDEQVGYGSLGGAGKGYTRVQIDEDAESATSMDDNTAYLFKETTVSNTLDDEEEGRDLLSQMQATKEFLTEGQRIAYVGVVRLSIATMLNEVAVLEKTKGAKKNIEYAMESMKMWGQKIMVRLYGHMNVDSAEQVMVEQLTEHGVLPSDLTPALMQNARVQVPAKDQKSETSSMHSARPSMSSPRPSITMEKRQSRQNLSAPPTPNIPDTPTPPPSYQEPPEYSEQMAGDLHLQDPSQINNMKDLDIDLRWTVLCDLFLLLIADSSYDARSRTLLEHVGAALSVPWQEICRFEKRVTDALEMQEQADKENWNEDEHLSARKKAARNKRLMVMGLCTVGGGLVIGLSAGLLAPVIGAGLAAGFGAIGVAGTETFLAGAGAAALIGSGGVLTGGVIGVKAANRRTGAVKSYEYRPLFNNKRTNLIVTVSGWMTGKVDDVRLPFSTVDPVMGDIYSINWEPEMLQSTGQTIQILATEALTQTIQQILAATALTGLMAGLSAPIMLAKLAYLIDNPWTVSLARADATGLILADSLLDRNLGVRPITLVGFSLGSRVIFSCLKELARRGAPGLVQNVYLFGSPILFKKEEYTRARTVVSGRFVNGYATNDWILGYLFRATTGGLMRVAGLTSLDVAGVENKDFTEIVPGHMAYRAKMPMLLHECGWAVDGLEFSEIEDPDPENHEKRQRELINEIEAARHVLEEGGQVKSKKSKFFPAFLTSRKGKAIMPRKQAWETYDERSARREKVLEGDEKASQDMLEGEHENGMGNIIFDVDAIRHEALKLALEEGSDLEAIKAHMSIREVQTTLPTLKLASPGFGANGANGRRSTSQEREGEGLRQTRSYDGPRRLDPEGHAGPPPPPTTTRLSYEGNGYGSWDAETSDSHSHSHGGEGEGGDGVKISLSFEIPSPEVHQNPTAHLNNTPPPARPPLRSAATAPSTSHAHGQHGSVSSVITEVQSPTPDTPDHNPWAEEREVEMSFE